MRVKELQAEADTLQDRVRAESAQKADLQASKTWWLAGWLVEQHSSDACMWLASAPFLGLKFDARVASV